MDPQENRLTGRELHALFDQLFPDGFSGADVLAEIAPEAWERSPLLACFHPSVEQLFAERVMTHRNRKSGVDFHGGAEARRLSIHDRNQRSKMYVSNTNRRQSARTKR